MKIEPYSPRHQAAWLDFFDHRAFCDNPALQTCYCTDFHRPRPASEKALGRVPNRDLAIRLLDSGDLAGYVLTGEDGRIFGWCSAHRKDRFVRTAPGPVPGEDPRILVIQCFVFDPAVRGQGWTGRFVERILDDARSSGFEAVEAYPRPRARTSAGSFHGGASVYRRLGFVPVLVNGKTVVRASLGPAPDIDKLAWVCVRDGKLLTVRSRGRSLFYLPGGKREPGESDAQALVREIREELAADLDPARLEPVFTVRAPADGQPEGTMVRLTCYRSGGGETLRAAAEIEELAWIGPGDWARCSPAAVAVLEALGEK